MAGMIIINYMYEQKIVELEKELKKKNKIIEFFLTDRVQDGCPTSCECVNDCKKCWFEWAANKTVE